MALIPFEDLPSTNTPLNATNLNFNFNEVLNLICPVGKVEVFFDNNDHSNYLGFTWERTCVGRTPVGIDTSQTEFDTIGETGGSKYLQEHIHNEIYWLGDSNYPISLNTSSGAPGYQMAWNSGAGSGRLGTSKAGTGNSGNLQPYQVVAFWKRTQ